MIRYIAFDFDGTLVHSNPIKREAMMTVAARHPDGIAIMEAILADPPGDRYAILGRFAAQIGVEDEAAAMVETYAAWCAERILTCPARAGADAALAALRVAGAKLYVNSATPTKALREIVAGRYEDGIFDGVYGGFGAKVANLRTIMDIQGAASEDVAMVGDGIDDHEAALAAGVPFFGIAGGTLAAVNGDVGLLSDLSSLPALILGWEQPMTRKETA